MSGDVINLRLARKRRAREEAEAAAAANRTRYGRSKQEKLLTGALRTIDEKRIEGSRREPHRRDDRDAGDE